MNTFFTKLSLLAILWLSIWGSLIAQNGKLIGSVVDSANQEPLYGATVKIGSTGTTTDFETSSYSIELPAGKHVVEFSFVGYDPISQEVTIEANKDTRVDMKLQETVTMLSTATVTTSKFEKPLGEVTVSLEIVQPKLLENTNAVAVDGVLGKVPGVNMLDGQVDIRGGAGFAQGTGSRVMILMDDLPILQADAGLPNWRDLPTENVAQIEVLKGAASALYGSAAMNGIINIRTAYPTNEPYTKVSMFYTGYDAPKDPANKWWNKTDAPYETGMLFSHRRKIGKLDLITGANFFDNQSFIRGGGTDSLANYDKKARGTLNLRYRFSDKLTFALNTNVNAGRTNRHLFWRQALGGSLYESDPTSIPIRGTSLRLTIDPNVTYYDPTGARHRLQGRYYYIQNDNANLQSNRSHYVFGEYQYQRRFKQLDDLDLAAGVVTSNTRVNAEVYGSNTFNLTNFAAYLQLDKKFFDRLSVSLGLRYELNQLHAPDSVKFGLRNIAAGNQMEGKPVMRVGVNYKLTEGTFLRGSWGQGYRFPTILEKYVSTTAGGGVKVYPNPTLTSETGWSAEIGVKQGFKISKWQGFVDVAAFWTEYQNMTEFQYNSNIFGFNVQNVGDTRVRGIDANIAGQGKFGDVSVDLLAGYTYIDPQYQNFDSLTRESSSSDKNVLKYRFKHTAKMDVQAAFKGFALGGAFNYFSFMDAIDAYLNNASQYPTIPNFRATHTKGTALLSARMSYTYKFAKISLLMNNLLNTEFSVRPGVLEAPRNLSLRADLTF